MRRTTALVLAILSLASARAFGDVTPQQFDDSIAKAVDWLYKNSANGTWDLPQPNPKANFASNEGGQWGGMTALATYALLAAGENPTDARLAPAIAFLKTANITGTYALAMRLNVCEQLNDSKNLRAIIDHDANTLLKYMHTGPQSLGRFYYDGLHDPAHDAKDPTDHSNSQIAVLGLWAAVDCGFEMSEKYWQAMEDAWVHDQSTEGAWSYVNPIGPNEARSSMTAAGVATLFITTDMLHGHEGVACIGNHKFPAIDAGRAWLATHIDQVSGNGNPQYNWYGVERVGLAGGYKYIGDTNWLQTGAAFMLEHQSREGNWGYWPNHAGLDLGGIANTSFALLFLAHGRAPVLLNKLEYSLGENPNAKHPANWDQRPRDCANLVHWAGRQSERFFNWQIVNLTRPPEDLHDAPILYIAGDRHGLSFTPDEEAKLRTFVEEGGLIVGNADCGIDADPFSIAYKKLGSHLFPAYEFRRLPKNHLLFHNQFDANRWADPLPVDALGNGSREFMLLFPVSDPPRFWQTGAFGGHNGSFEVMLNFYLYATDKLHHYRGVTWTLKPDAAAATRTIKVARLKYGGNWDPEPGGWRRFATFMHNREKVDLSVDAVDLGSGKLAGYSVAHLTGNTKFALASDQQAELKKFLSTGGTLILDACGGAPEFTDSAHDALAAILGPAALDQLKSPLPAASPAFSIAKIKCDAVGYRAFAQRTLSSLRTPRVRGIEIDGRIAVFLSPEDLSVGLVGNEIDGIYGYQPQATAGKDAPVAGASEIMANLILYAAPVVPRAAAQP